MKKQKQATSRNDTSQAASDVYRKQNVTIHRAMDQLGLPYDENKEMWLQRIERLLNLKHEVESLKELTLGERGRFIRALTESGAKVNNPWVPASMQRWRTGDAEIGSVSRPLRVPRAKYGYVRKIYAILTELKLPWAYVDKIAQERFGVERVEWLKVDDLEAVMKMMIYHQNREPKGNANG